MEVIYSGVGVDRTTDVSQFLIENFFPNEPISRALGLKTHEVERWFPKTIEQSLSQNCSLIATDSKSGAIVGVAINILIEKNINKTEEAEGRGLLAILNPLTEPVMVKIATFLGLLNKVPTEIYRKGVDSDGNLKTMNCVYLNVKGSHSGQKIGVKLVQKSELIAREKKVNFFQVDTTSEFSYQIFHKHCGFSVIHELLLADRLKNIQSIDNGVHKYGRILLKPIT